MPFFDFVLAIVIFLVIPTSNNLSDVKEVACSRFEEAGYKCVGYEGYQWGFGVGSYGGARVWYSLKRDNTNIMYVGYVQKWGDEYHIYGPTAVDAIKGQS